MSVRLIVVWGIFVLISTTAWSQINDLDLLRESGSAPVVSFGAKPKAKAFLRYNPLYWLMNGALTGYQKVVSPQLSASCMYELSCSRFSRESIRTFGILKGIALTADRLSRCNRVSATSIELIRVNGATGRVLDTPTMYRVSSQFEHLKNNPIE